MRQINIVFIFISFLCLTSCEQIIECIINKSPELPDKVLEVGLVNAYYSDFINAEIKNEPRDDDYGYYFELYGELPEGIEMLVDYRKVYFEGIPVESGSFDFTILLSVDPPLFYDFETDEYEDSLCSYSTTKGYTIRIQ
ncbi:hypothetical protein RXV94_11985 [Yeosuana sp. MJ-SS3]|uniref:DUF4249 family protein n=1 Tax=Gilvirhabdus luticola TaxID=3079858 RepID=A0ABU3U8Z5_9FLAO|nr:hypothetical protein [Yeosuana sp. MJ-SS3]MDU8886884.1 hypothetical protein [Yeosuana sp. MJ-SS3]